MLSSGIVVVERGPKLGDDAVGDRAAVDVEGKFGDRGTVNVDGKFGDVVEIDVGGKFGDIGCVSGGTEAGREGVKLGDDAVVFVCVVTKRVGKSGEEDRGRSGDASGTKAAGQMASAPSST
jgi:hypothetical protein